MIGTVLRSAGAVLGGLVVAAVLVVGVKAFSSVVHPFPPDVDPNDHEACKAHVARYLAWVLAVGAVAWGLTTFASAWLATRLGLRQCVQWNMKVAAQVSPLSHPRGAVRESCRLALPGVSQTRKLWSHESRPCREAFGRP